MCDNMSLVLSLSKGRGQSESMNRICRRVAALSIACNISLVCRWVASERNPADTPSRLWEREKPKKIVSCPSPLESEEVCWPTLSPSALGPPPGLSVDGEAGVLGAGHALDAGLQQQPQLEAGGEPFEGGLAFWGLGGMGAFSGLRRLQALGNTVSSLKMNLALKHGAGA